MFRITRKADYAVFILSYLARRANQEGKEALVSAQELASFSALNKSLVANLLKDLTRAGFLGSVRGARGGYRLARSAAEISLGEILRVVEGPFSFVECAHDRDAPGERIDHENCNLNDLCQSKGPLLVLHIRIQHMLDELKLSELSGLEPTQLGREVAADLFPAGRWIGPAPSASGGNGTGGHAAPDRGARNQAWSNPAQREVPAEHDRPDLDASAPAAGGETAGDAAGERAPLE